MAHGARYILLHGIIIIPALLGIAILYGQSLPPGAVNTDQPIKSLNLVKDFGADASGKRNSHQAFDSAATFINKRHGYVNLLIPPGTYLVGKQIRNAKEKQFVIGFKGIDLFSIDSCSKVIIRGSSSAKTKIKMMNGLNYGSFDMDGQKPANDESYNWYSHRKEKGFLIEKHFPNMASIGCLFKMSDCDNIAISDMEINGNSDNYKLGGNWSDKGRQIEADGIQINRSQKMFFSNITITGMGRDGILIIDPDTKDTNNLKSNEIVFKNISVSYSGRNGISWCGGDNISFTGCNVSFTGYGKIKTEPMAGLDIEPEGSVCRKGIFTHCEFSNNVNGGLIADRGDAVKKDAYNMSFTNCNFIQSSQDAYATFLKGYTNAFIFSNCGFYGSNYNAVKAGSISESTQYKKCIFEDCYKGKKAWKDKNAYLLMIIGTGTIIDNCIFNHFSIGAFAIRGDGKTPCDKYIESNKTYIKNSTFNSYLKKCTGKGCPSNGSGYAWLTRFYNNKFNYGDAPYLIDTSPGCSGSGNTDSGKGIQWNKWLLDDKMPQECY